MFTTFSRWNPFEELSHLHRQLDSMFNRHFNDQRPSGEDATPAAWTSSFRPSMDIVGRSDAWLVRLALPGISPDRVQVDVAGHALTVRGERAPEETATQGQYYSEIPYGRFERSIALPPSVDTDQIQASYQHGVLELRLPLKESVKPRRIEIATTDRKALRGAA